MQLNDGVMKGMAIGKVFKDSAEAISSLDFFSSGK